MTDPQPWHTRETSPFGYHIRMRRPEPDACHVNYEVRSILGRDGTTGGPLFRDDAAPHSAVTADPEAVPPMIAGTIKWDGCSHNNLGADGYVHLCGRSDAAEFATMLLALYDLAAELMPEHAEEMS